MSAVWGGNTTYTYISGTIYINLHQNLTTNARLMINGDSMARRLELRYNIRP